MISLPIDLNLCYHDTCQLGAIKIEQHLIMFTFGQSNRRLASLCLSLSLFLSFSLYISVRDLRSQFQVKVQFQVFQKFISPLIFCLEKCYIQFWKANSEYFSVVNISPPPTAVFGDKIAVIFGFGLSSLKIHIYLLVLARNTSKTVLKAFSECSAKLFGLPPLIAVFGGV